jgi:hypothetical protein
MTDLPPKLRRWKLYLPFVALAVVAVGWSAFWKVAAGMTETGLDDWFVQERAQGREWSCPNRSVGGYPFRLEVRCAAPSFTGRIGAMVGAGSVGDVLVAAHLYNPSLVLAQVGSPLAFKAQDGSLDLSLAWTRLQASHRVRKGGLERDSLEIEGPVLRLAGKGLPVIAAKAEAFEVHLRPNPDRASAVSAVDLALRLNKLEAPALDTLSGYAGPLDAVFAATILQTDALRGGDLAWSLEQWRQAGGNVEIREFKLAKGEALVEANGALEIDSAHRLAGRVELQLTGLGPLLQRFGVSPGNAAIGGLLGGLLGGRGQAGQNQGGAKGALHLPLDLNQGRAMIGPMRLPLVLNPLY